MKKNEIFTVWMLLIIIFADVSSASDLESKSLGNSTGDAQDISGPSKIKTRQGRCSYSLSIVEGQHVKYNDPEIIIYDSSARVSEDFIPYLWQAETASGYDWGFKNPGSLELKWVGLMCDSVENFPFSKSYKDATPPEYEQILELNATKCPAEIRDGKFSIRSELMNDESFIFQRLSGNNWDGFFVLHKKSNSKIYDRLRFCLIHDGSVLIGVSENERSVQGIGNGIPSEIERMIRTVKFND